MKVLSEKEYRVVVMKLAREMVEEGVRRRKRIEAQLHAQGVVEARRAAAMRARYGNGRLSGEELREEFEHWLAGAGGMGVKGVRAARVKGKPTQYESQRWTDYFHGWRACWRRFNGRGSYGRGGKDGRGG